VCRHTVVSVALILSVVLWSPQSCIVSSVHCADLLDVQGASQYFFSADTVGSPVKLKSHSFGYHLISESVSVPPSSVTEASLCSALFCVFMAPVRYNLEQKVFIYDCYVKKTYKSSMRKFHRNFPDTTCPSGDTVSKLVKKVRTHGIYLTENR
jgi:hypothetical protein